ncbi:hypothetical protein IT575_11480 [bacterium]|nr:hypothetical protein [bacterium]
MNSEAARCPRKLSSGKLRSWLDEFRDDYAALRSALGAPIRAWFWRHSVYWLLGSLVCTLLLTADQTGTNIGVYGLLARLGGNPAGPYISTGLHLLSGLFFSGFWISLASFAASRLEILRSSAPETEYSRLRQPLLLMLLLSGWPLLLISVGVPLLGSLTSHALVSIHNQMPSLIHSGLGGDLLGAVDSPLRSFVYTALLLCTFALLMRHSWTLLWLRKGSSVLLAFLMSWVMTNYSLRQLQIHALLADLLLLAGLTAPLLAAALLRRWQPVGLPRVWCHPIVLLGIFELLYAASSFLISFDLSGSGQALLVQQRVFLLLWEISVPVFCFLVLAPERKPGRGGQAAAAAQSLA